MTAVSACSYRAEGTYGGLVAEFDRLERQAQLTWDVELSLWQRSGLSDDGVVLDLGCGPGAVTGRLRAALPAATIIGADTDAGLLASVEPPVVRVVEGRIDLLDRTVDDVIVRYVLQHLPGPERARLLREAARVLAPGGRIHVVDVLDPEWGEVRPVVPGLARLYRRIAAHQADLGGNRTVMAGLDQELADAGFTAVRTRRGEVTSHTRPLADFAVHLGPTRYVPLVAEGALSSLELAQIAWAWHQVLTSDDPYVALPVHAVSAVRRPPVSLEGHH